MKWQQIKDACKTTNKDFLNHWHAQIDKAELDEALWKEELITQGIKAAHPDDGWVDRKQNKVLLTYPQFKMDINVGDKIALGQPDKFRVVEVTDISTSKFFSELVYYYFKEI